jgi:hypothetical protein
MKDFFFFFSRTVVVSCIFTFTVSCSGKKEAADEDKAQNNEPAVMEQPAEPAISGELRGWYNSFAVPYSPLPQQPKLDEEEIRTIKSHFAGIPQLDEETSGSIASYIVDCFAHGYDPLYNWKMTLDYIQYVKIPIVPIDPNWGAIDPVVFAADMWGIEGDSRGNIRLLIFYKEDGRIIYHQWEVLGWSYGNAIISITSGRDFNYDFIEDLQGRRIGDGSAFVGDFNHDGYDEITMFGYGPEGSLSGVVLYSILGFSDEASLYNRSRETLVGQYFGPIFEARLFLLLGWDVKTWEYGPPVQFCTYKGMEGFVIYERVPTGKIIIATYDLYGNPLDEISEYIQQWNFYAWDMEEGKYVFIDKMDPEDIKTQWQSAKK